jgi:multidrug efflux system membrane fusion protein
MASSLFKPSRIIAVGVVIAVVLWIGSGAFGQKEEVATAETAKPVAATIPVQKVGVTPAAPEKHQRIINLSCVTLADHKAAAVARGAGVITDLKISRGSKVNAGDILATVSDEGRIAAVNQAQALLDQRTAEYDANKRLIDRGDSPRNNLPGLEAAVAAARAGLASAKAESEKISVRSPIDGRVDRVPVQLGQAVQIGTEVAQVVDPDPMLAVAAVSEARRSALHVGQGAQVRFIDNTKYNATVNFVSVSADTATRTYRVEARMANADGAIPDGVTCEMTVTLESIEASAVPRSAIVFSDDGRLGVRIADSNSKAQFVPVQIVDDARDVIWLTGIDKATRVIVVGQDFVKDGDLVEAVSAAEATVKNTRPPA